MPTDRPARLLESFRAQGLLAPNQLEELSALPEAQDTDPRVLARIIVRRGWLTSYQVTQVLQGRGQELQLGPYRLLDRLGQGGMGQVFRALHQPTNRVVALKIVRKERLTDTEAVRRFRQEMDVAGQLAHPNIVRAYDSGQVVSTHYFAMEYFEGTDLSRLVKAAGPLPVGQACECIRQAALGLQHAHERGLVHRDLKPANLFLTRAPTSGTKSPPGALVKILD